MKDALSPADPIEVFALALKDPRVAQDWEAARPGVRLVVTTDRVQVYDSLEINPSGSISPQWCVWRNAPGGFHIGDWQREDLDRTFVTLSDALEFISRQMSES